jgi:hypothetical protein
LGIDPGIAGAFVLTNGAMLETWLMPITVNGKDKQINFDKVHEILWKILEEHPDTHVYLERAVSFGMGTKAAFNYGYGFACIVIALELHKMTYTLVEPGKWTKEMHEGISGDLKPKVKSGMAVKRLYPKLVAMLPTKAGMHDGLIDALLIAGYGLRKNGTVSKPDDELDFF